MDMILDHRALRLYRPARGPLPASRDPARGSQRPVPSRVLRIVARAGHRPDALRFRIHQRDIDQPEMSQLDRDPAGFVEQLVVVAHLHDHAVDAAQHRVDPVEVPDLLLRQLAFGDVLQRVEPARLAPGARFDAQRLHRLMHVYPCPVTAPQPVLDLGAHAAAARLDGFAAKQVAIVGMQEAQPLARVPRHHRGFHADQFRQRFRPGIEGAIRQRDHVRELRHLLGAMQPGRALFQCSLHPGRERPDLATQEQCSRHDHGQQHADGEQQLFADRREHLGSVDLDHHAEAQIAHRAIGGEHILRAVVARDRAAGLAAQRARHRQEFARDIDQRSGEGLRIEPLRKAMQLLVAQHAKPHVPGCAGSRRRAHQSCQYRQRLLDTHLAHLARRVVHREAVTQHQAVVPQQLGAGPGRKRDRDRGRLDETAAARHQPAVCVVVRDGADFELQEALDDGPDVRQVRTVVAPGADHAQVARRGRPQRGALGLKFVHSNHVLEYGDAVRERRMDVVAHLRLNGCLQDGKCRDHRAQRDRAQDRRAGERDPVVLARKKPRAAPVELPPVKAYAEGKQQQACGGGGRNAEVPVLGKEQIGAEEIRGQAERADRAGGECQRAHRGRLPGVAHARDENKRRAAHEEGDSRRSRHPSRVGIPILVPLVQRAPVDAKVGLKHMLREHQRRDSGDDAAADCQRLRAERTRGWPEQRAAGQREAQRRAEHHRRRIREDLQQVCRLQPSAEHDGAAEEREQRAREAEERHAPRFSMVHSQTPPDVA